MRRALFFAALMFGASVGSCTDPLSAQCHSDTDCPSGFCYKNLCVTPDADASPADGGDVRGFDAGSAR